MPKRTKMPVPTTLIDSSVSGGVLGQNMDLSELTLTNCTVEGGFHVEGAKVVFSQVASSRFGKIHVDANTVFCNSDGAKIIAPVRVVDTQDGYQKLVLGDS